MQDIRQARTEQKYKNAFWDLLEKKPYQKLTVTDFGEVCGLNRKTFYTYYPDVETLARECVDDLIDDVLRLRVQDYTEWDATYIMFENISRNSSKLQLVSDNQLDSMAHQYLRERMQNLAAQVVPVELGFDAELLHEYTVAITWRCMMWGARHADWSLDEMTRVCLNTYKSFSLLMAEQYKPYG